MAMKCEYGVIFPHFGRGVSRARILSGAVLAEQHGFDSVWFRDHLLFAPHAFESQDRSFVEVFAAMTAVAAVTERIKLGSAALIPFRHPIHVALQLASLDVIAGSNRIISGWGAGRFDHEFDAVGMNGWKRGSVVNEQLAIVRSLIEGESVSHDGTHYHIDSASIRPTPELDSIRFWYCGSSVSAVRRAVERFDGWGPVRFPLRELRTRLAELNRLSSLAGKVTPSAVWSWVSPGPSIEEGLSKIDLPSLLAEANRSFAPTAAGTLRSIEDLDGALLAGPAEALADGVQRYIAAGVGHFVFDLRHRFADWEECVAYIGDEVLPILRARDVGPSPGARDVVTASKDDKR